MDDDLDTSLEEPQNEYEGNKDAARALLRVKQKLDGYEEGEMRSIHGQVFCQIYIFAKSLYMNLCVFLFLFHRFPCLADKVGYYAFLSHATAIN